MFLVLILIPDFRSGLLIRISGPYFWSVFLVLILSPDFWSGLLIRISGSNSGVVLQSGLLVRISGLNFYDPKNGPKIWTDESINVAI